jgi:hypothetical protein
MKGIRHIANAFEKLCNFLPSKEKLTIVTGANSPFYDSLCNNLLKSILQFENADIVVWDLGLTNVQLLRLKEDFPKVFIKTFNYDLYPNYFDVNRFPDYAFKSVCIYETLLTISTKYLLWLDAGCGINHRLNSVRYLLKIYGFYSPFSSTNNELLTYKSVISHFNFTSGNIGHKQMLSSGIVGIDRNCFKAISIIREWYDLTFNRELLAPTGSNKSNHRQDQSLLSCVYYSRKKNMPILASRFYNILVH